MPPARRPRGVRAGYRVRRVGSTHASDAASGGAARAGRLCERTTADTARRGRSVALCCWPERHRRLAAAALWRRCGLRESGARHAASHGRPGCEARAAFRQQKRQVKPNKVKLSQYSRVRLLSAHRAGGASTVGGELGGGAFGGGGDAGDVGARAATVHDALERHNRTCEARRPLSARAGRARIAHFGRRVRALAEAAHLPRRQKRLSSPPPTLGDEGQRPDAKDAPMRTRMGAWEHRHTHAYWPSSVMDEMQASTVVPEYPRSLIGLRSMRRQAAASLAHLLVLLGPAQRRPCKRQTPPRRLMDTPTCRPALHLLEGLSESIGTRTTGSIWIGCAPASATQPSSP